MIQLYEKNGVRLRCARIDDASALAAIYVPYVEKTAISCEYEAPSSEEFARRMAEVMDKYPYLVAEEGDVPLGYAYAAPFAERAAYDWAAEISITLRGHGEKRGSAGCYTARWKIFCEK